MVVRERQTTIRTSEVRQSFLEFFRQRGHRLVESSPVVPFDDPTILFTNAGMNQFKDVFTGKRKPDFPRATSSQKCIRAGGKHNDLDNVGFTARHHTFFEMLGNFSFGDYFKAEAIEYGWEWVTKTLGLPKDRLYATVYLDDDEAYRLWAKFAPELRNGRILRFGKKDNYWSMGDIGPCGPCSEIHFDRGEKFGDGPNDIINGDTDRFVEIWNLVFMQFEQMPDGKLVKLPKPSVDTGAGLERITAIMNDAESNYGIDIFQSLIRSISEITGSRYEDHVPSHHVVADHIRALTFALSDGAGISNEGRGYVLRRILRRAARHGRELGAKEPFLHKLVPTLVGEMGDVYPEIRQKKDYVVSVIEAEEESFARTLDTGLELLSILAREVKSNGSSVIPGGDVFRLYDTYGFPYDLTETIAAEQGLALDREGFDKAMAAQQERSRGAASFEGQAWAIEDVLRKTKLDIREKTEFVGYEVLSSLAIVRQVLHAETLDDPSQVTYALILDQTPFYVEAGGQITDTGVIRGRNVVVLVDKIFLLDGWFYVHLGRMSKGTFEDLKELAVPHDRLDDVTFVEPRTVTAQVDAERRWDIMRNHTATHLAHAALRKVLGEHVKQSGSYVGDDKLRFDFSHHQPMSPDEIAEVERLVNEQILKSIDVKTDIMPVEEAKKSGAMALFGEKYGDTVRVVSVPGFSKELCGGTHVQNTSQIGPFFITVETGIASGVRRLEAVTGREAQKQMLERKRLVLGLSSSFNRPESELLAGVEALRTENAALQKEIRRLKTDLVSGAGQSLGSETKVGALSVWVHDFGESDRETMAAWMDSRKESNQPVVALGVGMTNGKTAVMLAASSAAIEKHSVNAGNLLRDLLAEHGGRGGGKPNFAQGGTASAVNPELLKKKLITLLNG
ncbi:MAG: alanine--tRNA ligase [Candidatus Zixiibacteriota bacterium]